MVKLISRREKARPGTTTEQAKPVSNCNSLRNVAFFSLRKLVVNCEHNLSAGRPVDSQRPVSSSTPAKVKIVEGPNVFSGVMGMPKKSHSSKNGRRLTEHSKWMRLAIQSLSWAIHAIAVLKVSKVLQELEHPDGHAFIKIMLSIPLDAQQMIILEIYRKNPESTFDISFSHIRTNTNLFY